MLLSIHDRSTDMPRLIAVLTLLVAQATPPAATDASSLLVDAASLAAAIGAPDLVVLHVADRAAHFEQGHIPGARFLRYGDIAVDGDDGLGSELPAAAELQRTFRAAGISTRSRVVVYGASTVAAARAFFTLDVMGHRQVALLDGGLAAWRAAGRTVDTGRAAAPAPGDFTPQLDAARLASADQIQQSMRSRTIALVDVRPDPEFLGSDGGMHGRHAAGHIDGARQLPWNTLVAPDGRFLPRAQLAERLAAAGAVHGKPVVAYCMVGMRASVVYFVARFLGHEARLYDGSIVDWSRRKLPVTAGRR
jgi:thiosulfate/3-mercaptopyruvate sulfurtransferase